MPDLIKGLEALMCVLTLGERKTEYSDQLAGWGMGLYHHCTTASSDAGTRTRTAKEYFTLCRANALEGEWKRWKGFPSFPFGPNMSSIDKRRTLHQVSRTSRALREADSAVVSDSLKSHWELASTEFETPEELRESFRLFCKSRFGGSFVGKLGGIKPSSSFSRTKAQGGALAELKEITDQFRARLISHLDIPRLTSLAEDVIPDCYPVFGQSGRETFLSRGSGGETVRRAV